VTRRWPSVAAGILVALLAVLSVLHAAVPPDPRPADAPAGEFSARRALTELEQVARQPHPAGSEANQRVRDRLESRLEELGLRPTVQASSAGVPGSSSSHAYGWAENVHATLRGTTGAGRVLLVAHYDSVEVGPGASDDGVGVSALLEIARALTSAPPPAADVTFLFTDSEEFALLGARAFVDAGLGGDPARTVVLNLDARGTSGRTIMFETGEHSAALVPALRERLPQVTSLSQEVYRLLPNETDFTAFRAAGYTGMNFAMVDGSAPYHSELDDLSHVDLESLQDMGESVLGATRTLAGTDLGEIAGAGESVYFSVFGLLVRYPAGAVLALAVFALAGAAASVWFARRRLGLWRTLRCAAATLVVPVGCAVVGWLVWQVMLLVDPRNGRFLGGDPYAVSLARVGLMALAVVVAALWLVWVSRWSRPTEVAAAGVLVTAVLAVVVALLLPGAAYLFTWPAVAGSVALVVATLLPEDSPWRAAVAWLAGVPAVLLGMPLVWLLFGTVGLALAMAPLLLFGLAAVTVLPAWRTPPRGRAVLAAVTAVAVAAGGLIAVDTVVNATDGRGPAQVSLVYALDTDRRAAYWVSEGEASDEWVRQFTPTEDPELEQRFPVLSSAEGIRRGEAPVTEVPEATVTVVDQTRDGELRRLRLRISVTGRPTQLALYANTGGAPVERAEIAGTSFSGKENRPFTDTGWRWGLVLSAPPADGVELTLTVRGGAPARLLLVAQSPSFPLDEMDRPRPDTIRWGGHSTGLAFAARSYRI
jgi:hypothetical protein